MKGVIILTEGRSGSNWLGSLASSAGVLGVSKEWVDSVHSGLNPKRTPCDKYIETILTKAATPNGFFAIKLFPRHLHSFQMIYGCDFIKRLRQQHDILFILLTRRDRVKQAISFSKAFQTGGWKNTTGKKNVVAKYDFDMICRSYFMIGRSYDFWTSYIEVLQLQVKHLVYEDLLDDPSIYIDLIAKHAGNPKIDNIYSDMTIQRNSESEEWTDRFAQDIKMREFVANTTPAKNHPRTLSNLARFFRGKQMKPVPYS